MTDLDFIRTIYEPGIARLYWGDQIVGTGFHVQGGYVLTCAHVIVECFGQVGQEIPDESPGSIIELDFPFVARGRKLEAEVCLWKLNGEDVAGVRILGEVPSGVKTIPFRPSQVEAYRNHSFYVFGFPQGYSGGIPSEGKLKTSEAEHGWTIMQVGEQGYSILPGFSGSAVWDEQIGCAVGMTVARDGENMDARVGFMIPYPILKPALDAIALFVILIPHKDVLRNRLKAAYSIPSLRTLYFEDPESLQDAILKALNLPNNSQFRPIDLFVAHLVELLEDTPQLKQQLEAWLVKHRQDLSVLQNHLSISNPSSQKTANLLFCVYELYNSDLYWVQAYVAPEADSLKELITPEKFLVETTGVTFERIPEILYECIGECLGLTLIKEENLVVEVFLPLAKLDQDVEYWPDSCPDPYCNPKPEPICCRHRVVLRCAERSIPVSPYNKMKPRWLHKLEAFQTGIQSNAPLHGLPIFCGNREDGEFWTDPELQNQPQNNRLQEAIVMYFTQPPQPVSKDSPGLLPYLVREGITVAFWPRKDLPGYAELCRELLESGLTSLASRVDRLRREAYEPENRENQNHLGRHLSLVWDDPALEPRDAYLPLPDDFSYPTTRQ